MSKGECLVQYEGQLVLSCKANDRLVLPPTRRKGRPPKRPPIQQDLSTSTPGPTLVNAYHDVTISASKDAHQGSWMPCSGMIPPLSRVVAGAAVEGSNRTDSSRIQQGYDKERASQSLATLPLRNTSDAIRLLDQDRAAASQRPSTDLEDGSFQDIGIQFFLVSEGLIDECTLFKLFAFYMRTIHQVMPLIPHERRPKTPEQVLSLAAQDKYLVAAIVVVASNLMGEPSLHLHLWRRVERLFAQVTIQGVDESLDLLEGLLLLSGL
jgi:hypothetical protein